MVKLTNFQQIAPSHVQPLFCPLLYIPRRASASEGLDSQRQCGSISCNASRYRLGGKEEKKKSLVFSFLFQVRSERFPDTDSRSSDSRRNTGFHCAAIREGEKERERERVSETEGEREPAGCRWGRRAGAPAPWWKAGAAAPVSNRSQAPGNGVQRPPSG